MAGSLCLSGLGLAGRVATTESGRASVRVRNGEQSIEAQSSSFCDVLLAVSNQTGGLINIL